MKRIIRSNHSQITRIHILKNKLGMDDDAYRAALAQYRSAANPADCCVSSKDLTYADARAFIRQLEDTCKRNGAKVTTFKKKYAGEKRPTIYASPAQKRMLEGMWKDYCDLLIALDSSRADLTTPQGRNHALTNFMHNRWLYGGVDNIPREAVGKVVAAIESMLRQEQRKLDKEQS